MFPNAKKLNLFSLYSIFQNYLHVPIGLYIHDENLNYNLCGLNVLEISKYQQPHIKNTFKEISFNALNRMHIIQYDKNFIDLISIYGHPEKIKC